MLYEVITDRRSRNRAEAVRIREQVEEARQLVETLQSALTELKGSRETLFEERAQLQESLTALRRRIDENERLLTARREELSRNGSRLDSLRQLENDLEGYRNNFV